MTAPARERKGLMEAVGSISLATLISRILGLARDQAQSFFFGAGLVTDAFVVAFRVPNLLRDLFAEGAMSAAFVPTFTRERIERGPESAWRLANRVFAALAVVLCVITVVLLVFAPQIVGIYAAGFDPRKLALTVSMTRVLAPFLLFAALAAVAMGILNACGRFFVPALAPAWFNVAAILGMLLLIPVFRRIGVEPVLSLAIGAMAGGVLQFVVQIPALHGEGYAFRPELVWNDPGLRRIVTLMIPATFGLAATQINILVDTLLASSLGDGPVTWLALAFRLMQLPIGLFGVAIATANLTRVSRDVSLGDAEGLRKNLAASIRAAAVLTLPATAGLVALREPVVRLLFEHGRFSAHSTDRTAAAVLCYALGLFAYSVVKIQVPTFYALGDTRTPVLASTGSVLLKIGANFAMLATLPLAGVDPFLALALSTSLSAWANFLFLGRALNARAGSLRGFGVGRALRNMTLLSAAMGVACALLHSGLERFLPGGGFAGELARLLVTVGVGIWITIAGVGFAGIPEGKFLAGRLRSYLPAWSRFGKRG